MLWLYITRCKPDCWVQCPLVRFRNDALLRKALSHFLDVVFSKTFFVGICREKKFSKIQRLRCETGPFWFYRSCECYRMTSRESILTRNSFYLCASHYIQYRSGHYNYRIHGAASGVLHLSVDVLLEKWGHFDYEGAHWNHCTFVCIQRIFVFLWFMDWRQTQIMYYKKEIFQILRIFCVAERVLLSLWLYIDISQSISCWTIATSVFV